jgi:hypothetical protein
LRGGRGLEQEGCCGIVRANRQALSRSDGCGRNLGLPGEVVHVLIRGSSSSRAALHQARQTSRRDHSSTRLPDEERSRAGIGNTSSALTCRWPRPPTEILTATEGTGCRTLPGARSLPLGDDHGTGLSLADIAFCLDPRTASGDSHARRWSIARPDTCNETGCGRRVVHATTKHAVGGSRTGRVSAIAVQLEESTTRPGRIQTHKAPARFPSKLGTSRAGTAARSASASHPAPAARARPAEEGE